VTNRPTIEPECLAFCCHKPAKQRGLCFTCYKSARKAIKQRETTEDELMALGLMARKQRGGWGSGLLMQALETARNDKRAADAFKKGAR
jgi:hypothetical protein